MPYNLQGRVCLVTGGSRGIGAQIVRRFSAEGCHIAINYLASHDASAELAEQMRNEHDIKTTIIQGDISKLSDCKNVVQQTIKDLGGLDIIVNNAGNTKFAPFGDIYALEPEDWDYAWHALVMSNLWLLQEARPTFQANEDGGCLLIMSSVAGLVNNGTSLAYSVTRAASLALNRCLAQSQGSKIRINAVCPGYVPTERTAAWKGGDEFKEMAALKRLTTTDDVAEAFLALAKNPALTGERLRVDSGMFVGQ